MLCRNELLHIGRVPALSPFFRTTGITITMLNEMTQTEGVWTFRPTYHMVLVYLADSQECLETQLNGRHVLAEPPRAGAICSVPAGSRYKVRLHEQALPICGIGVQETTSTGQVLQMSTVVNFRDRFLHQTALRFLDLVGTKGKSSRLLLDSLAASMQRHIIETYCYTEEAKKPSLDRPLGTKARVLLEQYIQNHLADRITLKELAHLAGLNTHNLLKRFRVSFGTTPAQYIISERIVQAQLLLQQPALRITDVALTTGFYSPSHFSTVFSKHVGVTPSSYRQKPLC